MNGEQSGTGTFSSGSKNATDTSFGAGYSGKTEGNGWDDETKETIGQPKPKKKPSEAASGGSSGGPATVEKTMGKAEAYKKQEKQMSERVAAMESVQASKKPWWRDRDLLMGGLIPLPFMPEGVQKVLELTPFAAMQNLPLRAYTGQLAGEELLWTAVLQVFWLAVLILLGRLWMKRALRRVVIQGG